MTLDSLAIAFFEGLAKGWLGPPRPPSARRRYFNGSMDRLRDFVHSTSGRVFTTNEAEKGAGLNAQTATVHLKRLVASGHIRKLAYGRWQLASAPAVVPPPTVTEKAMETARVLLRSGA